MINFSAAIDIFRHMKGDTGLMPGSSTSDWLDTDHRPLWQMLECQPEQFHLHCVHAPQQYDVTQHLPLIWFTVEASYGANYPADASASLRVAFRVYADDPSGVAHNAIAQRIQCLFDRQKDGQTMWHACPPSARYAPFSIKSVSAIEPCAWAGRLYRMVIVMTGKAHAQTNLRGVPFSN